MLGGSVYPACSRLWFPWREIGRAFKNWLNPGVARGGEMGQSSQACQWAPSTAPSFPSLLAPQLPVWLLPQHSCSGLTSKLKAHGLVFEAGPLLLAQEAPFPWSLPPLTPPVSCFFLVSSLSISPFSGSPHTHLFPPFSLGMLIHRRGLQFPSVSVDQSLHSWLFTRLGLFSNKSTLALQ